MAYLILGIFGIWFSMILVILLEKFEINVLKIKNAGRRISLIIANIISICGMILTAIATYSTMVVGRCLIGFAAGMVFFTVPLLSKWKDSFKLKKLLLVYETSPFEKRWQLLSLIGVVIGIAFLFVYAYGLGDTDTTSNKAYWRFITLFPIVFNIIQILMFGLIIESPRYYLVSKGDLDRVMLRFLYLNHY